MEILFLDLLGKPLWMWGLFLAFVLFLPIPFANGMPALAIIALGLALSERDRVWLIAGFIGTFLGIGFVATLIGGGTLAIAKLL